MFASDKELRRPPGGNRRGGGSGGRGGPQKDIVEKTRLERAQRETLRLHTSKAVIIQAFMRGRLSSLKLFRHLETDLQKKLSDIKAVASMLQKTKDIFFVPPVNVVAAMLPSFVYVCKRKAPAEVIICI